MNQEKVHKDSFEQATWSTLPAPSPQPKSSSLRETFHEFYKTLQMISYKREMMVAYVGSTAKDRVVELHQNLNAISTVGFSPGTQVQPEAEISQEIEGVTYAMGTMEAFARLGNFDLLFVQNATAMGLQDPEKLTGLCESLIPGGQLVVSFTNPGSHPLEKLLGTLVTSDTFASYLNDRPHYFSAPTLEEYVASFHKNGLRNHEVRSEVYSEWGVTAQQVASYLQKEVLPLYERLLPSNIFRTLASLFWESAERVQSLATGPRVWTTSYLSAWV